MKRGFRRRARLRSHFGGTGSWGGYFRLRKNSVVFLGLFLGGLLLGSLYTVRDCGGQRLILTMMANQLQAQAAGGFWQVLTGRLVTNLGYIIFLYFAANCVQGKWLSGLVPAFYGLSVGSSVTAILYQHGIAAGGYLAVCVLAPRFCQLILLMTACNQSVKLSQNISAKKPAGEQSFLLLGTATVLFSGLEALVLSRFTGLLTYL